MSGFREDVISILNSNGILQKESMGWIVSQHTNPDNSELFLYLAKQSFPVTDRFEKSVFYFDYIIIDHLNFSLPNFIKALSMLGIGGVIVIELAEDYFNNNYYSIFGNFSIIKVTYGDKRYLVVKGGVDYGN